MRTKRMFAGIAVIAALAAVPALAQQPQCVRGTHRQGRRVVSGHSVIRFGIRSIRSRSSPWSSDLSASSAQGRLLSTLLASIAEFERELIRERTGEGRKRAMAAGIKFGRKRIKRRAAGETLASIAKSYGVHLAMISRL